MIFVVRGECWEEEEEAVKEEEGVVGTREEEEGRGRGGAKRTQR